MCYSNVNKGYITHHNCVTILFIFLLPIISSKVVIKMIYLDVLALTTDARV